MNMGYKDPDKQREYQRLWRAARRADWLTKNGPCACGSWLDLEVDHVDRTKKLTHNVWSWRTERREAELAKCQVLCRECHLSKTIAESVTHQHGTYAMRNNHGCKCFDCMEYVRRIKRASRARLANG